MKVHVYLTTPKYGTKSKNLYTILRKYNTFQIFGKGTTTQ